MSYTREVVPEYAVLSEQEAEEAKASSRILLPQAQSNRSLTLRLIDNEYQQNEALITLPPNAVRLLLAMLVQMGEGNAVTIIPTQAELTTQQAANLLNVSRPFLVQLLEKEEIPFHKVGTHRRILLKDLLAYKDRIDVAREDNLVEMTALDQELGLY